MKNENHTTITRESLARALKREMGLSLKQSAVLVEDMIDIIVESLASGKNIKIQRFGAFVLRHKKERMGRNPKTLEPAVISARTVVTFKASSTLKKQLTETRQYVAAA